MVKKRVSYVCSNCSYTAPKWLGRCPECGEWNTLEEKSETVANDQNHRLFASSPDTVFTHITDVKTVDSERIPTKYKEFDRIMGGGVVKGSYNLISGHPGIGKSTLMLQLALEFSKTKRVLYLSAEESVSQVKIRFERLSGGDECGTLFLSNESNLDKLRAKLDEEHFDILFCDSIQSVYSPEVLGIPGSVSQIKECAVRLLETSKRCNITVFVVGHVTKTGAVAGPMLLEHMVDSVLLFEGDPSLGYRILRCSKNRFGATDEVGIFTMTSNGLVEVENPSEFFLTDDNENGTISGSARALVLEGTRPFLIEVQSLVTSSNLPQPRRVATGFDIGRLAMLCAILEKRCDIYCSSFDIFVNIVGGLRVKSTSVDMPLVASLLSSILGLPLPPAWAFIGEIGLGGEIRDVPGMDILIKEGVRLGLSRIFIPQTRSASKYSDRFGEAEIVKVKRLDELREQIAETNIFETNARKH